MEDTQYDPFPKDLEVEVPLQLTSGVQYRMMHGAVVLYVALKHQRKQTEPTSEEHVVEGGEPVDEVDLPAEAIPVGKVQLGEDQDDILVEVVADHFADTLIARPTMHEKETLQEAKL